MKFTDLFFDFPSIKGIYDVKVMNFNGGIRVAKAYWDDSGFSLLKGNLQDSEYIFSWRNSDIIVHFDRQSFHSRIWLQLHST
ncbi:hypothetical protein V8G69_01615 [Gaetbulibacter sp. M235]|uniref:hypothetical protein n=1 Tax=Gaetbulibacter sp. M235 TaxID=3126510 RepID=UPI00374F51CB